MSSAKCCPFRLGLNVLNAQWWPRMRNIFCLGYKLGTFVWLIYYYLCCETSSTFVLVTNVNLWLNPNVRNSALWLTHALPSQDTGGNTLSTLQWRRNERDGVSNHQPHECLLDGLFRCRSKKTSKLRVTGLCEGNSPVNSEFPIQRASSAENVSIWWRNRINVDDKCFVATRWVTISGSSSVWCKVCYIHPEFKQFSFNHLYWFYWVQFEACNIYHRNVFA